MLLVAISNLLGSHIDAFIGPVGKTHRKFLRETGVRRLQLITDDCDPYIEIEDDAREKALVAARRILNDLVKDLNVSRDSCRIQFIG